MLSRLVHPNIATLFDFDSHDGIDFLVLEFVRDQALGLLKVHPRLDPLRQEPRFRDLLTRMRLD